MKPKIKNLLFDLGGVIIDIERNNCVRAFEKLGLPNADSYFGEYVQSGVFRDIEGGKMGVDQFHQIISAAIPHKVTYDEIDAAFCKFLLGIPRERLVALRQLRRNYGIFMLSNTNPIMWNSDIARFFRIEGLEREDYFDGIVTSFEARLLKPDPEIFEYTARHLSIDPSETLFLDDGAVNVEAARRCGYHAEQVTTDRGFIDIVREYES